MKKGRNHKNIWSSFTGTCRVFVGPPSKPSGPIAVKDLDRNSVTIEWKAPKDDGGSPVTRYVIEKRDAKRSLWSPVGKVDSDTFSCKATDLTEGADYVFRVIAENAKGAGDALEMEDTVQPRSPYGESNWF